MSAIGRSATMKARTAQVLRAETRRPRYHAVLPTVYPYFKLVTKEDCVSLCTLLMEETIEGSQEGMFFATSGHPRDTSGKVTLWLSRMSAEWLMRMDYVADVSEYAEVKRRVEL